MKGRGKVSWANAHWGDSELSSGEALGTEETLRGKFVNGGGERGATGFWHYGCDGGKMERKKRKRSPLAKRG